MSIVTLANVAHAGPATRQSGPTTAGDPGEVDFAGLFGAGIGRKAATLPVPDSTEVAKDPKAKTEGDKDAVACDPAALLDAIAAGQAGLDPKQAAPATAPVAPQATSASTVPDEPTALSAMPAGVAKPDAGGRSGTRTVAARADGAKSGPDAGTQKSGDIRATEVPHDAGSTSTAIAPQAAQPAPTAIAPQKQEIPEQRQESTAPLLSAQNNAAGLAHPAQQPHAPAIAAIAARMEQLAQPMGSPAWDDGFSSHIVWMAKNDVQSASIRLNPPDLGPVEVRLTLTNDQGAQSASVQFSAAHAATRDAIESAMPRLREMLQENGIALGNTTVDAGNAGHTNDSADSSRHAPGDSPRGDRTNPSPETEIQPRPGHPLRRGNGLVDTFA